MENRNQAKPGSNEKGVASSERRYWIAVNIAWVLYCVLMLLCMYLVYGSDFWKEFFK